MAKDFLQDCPEVQFTDREENADYKVKLNHLELGLFIRDNQIAVMDAFGFAFHEREEQYPAGGQRCLLSDTADWSNQASFRQKMIDAINGSFRKEGVEGYAEIPGDKLIVHSQRASAMRFHMVLSSQRQLSMMRHAGISTYVYTDDAYQNFLYDLRTGQIMSAQTETANQTNGANSQAAAPR